MEKVQRSEPAPKPSRSSLARGLKPEQSKHHSGCCKTLSSPGAFDKRPPNSRGPEVLPCASTAVESCPSVLDPPRLHRPWRESSTLFIEKSQTVTLYSFMETVFSCSSTYLVEEGMRCICSLPRRALCCHSNPQTWSNPAVG